MSDPVSDNFVVHRDEVESIHIHMGEHAELRRFDLELPGEQPLWVDRTTLPDGPTLPPIVLIHGFAQNRFSWDTKIRSLSGWLATKGWDVWNLELRGHGRSRRRGGTIATTFSDYPDDLIALPKQCPNGLFGWVIHWAHLSHMSLLQRNMKSQTPSVLSESAGYTVLVKPAGFYPQ